jgi:hypothetical protein
VGVALCDFAPERQEEGIRRLLVLAGDPEVRGRCVEVARRYFSLDKGVQSYDHIYLKLVKGLGEPR